MLCYVVVCGHGESPAFKIPGYGQRPYSFWFGISSILGDFELSLLGSAHTPKHSKTRKNPKKPEKMGKVLKTSPTPSTPRIREKCRELPPLFKHAQNREKPEKQGKTTQNLKSTHTNPHTHTPLTFPTYIYIYIYYASIHVGVVILEGCPFWRGPTFEDPF